MKQTNLSNYFNIIYHNKTPNNSPIITSNNNNRIIKNNLNLNNNYYLLKFDGASKGNPGKAGAGAVMYDSIGNEIFTISRYLGKQTNNYAEYFALLLGLQEASKINIEYLKVEGDSLLVINQINGKYKIKNEKLKTIYLAIQPLLNGFKDIKFKHIYRKNNIRADELANNALN